MVTSSLKYKAIRLSKHVTELREGMSSRFFEVESGKNKYQVSTNKDGSWWCDCQKFSLYGLRNGECSHILSVQIFIKEKENVTTKK